MRKIIYFFILVFVIPGFTACYYHNEEMLYTNVTNSCDTTNITFKAKVAPIFKANCLSCHGNSVASFFGGGVRLEDYVDVKAHLDRAYGAMSHLPGYSSMPKGMSNKIDECQIKIVGIWKDAGGLNN